MNGSVINLLKRIIFNLNIALDDKDKLGKLFTEYASHKERRFVKFIPNRILSQAIKKIRPGYGMVGEIVLEQLGLISKESMVPKNIIEETEYAIKTAIKRWVKGRLYLEGFIADGSTALSKLNTK